MQDFLWVAGLTTLFLFPFIIIGMMGGFERPQLLMGTRARPGCSRTTYGEWPSWLVRRNGQWVDTRTGEILKTLSFGEMMARYEERK